MKLCQRLSGLALLALACALPAAADLVRDGSIGPGSGVQPTGPDFLIDQSMGSLSGGNLFHSFAEFNLAAGQSATFTAVDPVNNLIARVTGGASSIDGSLVSLIPGADFYLINPAGVLIGAEASIEVDGSFHLSSADRLHFADDGQLDTDSAPPALLSSAAPSAFGFTSAEPAGLGLAGGEISVAAGREVWLVGGAIGISGDPADTLIEAESGLVALISLAGAGEVALADGAVSGATPLGAIRLGALEDEAEVPDADPADGDDEAEAPVIPQIDVSGDPAGRVLLKAASLTVEDFTIAANTLGAASRLDAGISAEIDGGVELSGEAALISSTAGDGDGGSIRIRAESIELADDSEILTDSLAGGAGGLVRLEAGDVILSGDAEIASDAEGNGAGGSVEIVASRLRLQGNPEISSDTDPDSAATGGSVDITATESVLLDIPGSDPAGLFTNSEGSGDAGRIRIRTPLLRMNGGVVTAETSGVGLGGNVEISAASLSMSNGASIAALSSGEFVGAGDAGNVRIDQVRDLTMDSGSSVVTRSQFSDGGNIVITASGLVRISDGLASANVGDGVGGNLDISGDSVILHNSDIVAQAGAGQGGAISIGARRFLASETLISASSETGISGTVEINAPEVDLSGSLAALPSEFVDAAALLRATCAARGAGAPASRFTVASRRGLPADESGLPLQLAGVQVAAPSSLTRPDTDAVIELSRQARDAVAIGDAAGALRLLDDATAALPDAAPGSPLVYAQIHLAGTVRALAVADRDDHDRLLLQAHALLTDAAEAATTAGDPRAASYAQGNLASLYADRQRSTEALLLARRALRLAEAANAPESIYRWQWLQARLLWRQGRAQAALTAYRAAVAVLEETRQEAFVREDIDGAFFNRSIAPVYMDLVDTLLQAADLAPQAAQGELLLREARGTIERFRAAELRDYFGDPCVAELQARSTDVDRLSDRAAIIYPVLLPQRLELLVTLPGGLRRYPVPVEARQLAREAHRFRAALQQTGSQRFLASGRRLYDWLIRPMQTDLQASGVETLVFVPDGPLRGIPMAALLDGDRFLIEDYAVAITPGLNLVDAQPLGRDNLQVLLAGLSDSVQGFSGLPNVETELQAARSLFGGELLLNQTFNSDSLRAALAGAEPGLVHIASHAQFGGRAEDNFVLTYDGRLSMDRLAELIGVTQYREQPLQLLVLSACQTAVGDNRAALGLAGVAVRAGARSVVGSLWSIADEATSRLVQDFYDALRQPGVSRAAALRSAQLRLLGEARLRHPYFWSPFLLISNWL